MGKLEMSHESLSDQAHHLLKKQIEKNVFPGGKLPPERELCKLLGISRITVRGALTALEEEGMVCKVHGKGTFVSDKAVISKNPLNVTKTIALLFPGSSDRLFRWPYYSRITGGMVQACTKNQFTFTMCNCETRTQISNFVDMCDYGRYDGAVMLMIDDEDVLSRVLETGVPSIVVDEDPKGIRIDSVDINSYTEAVKAVNHLINQGHRRIAYLDWDQSAVSNPGRRSGYMAALDKAGIDIDESLIEAEKNSREGGYRSAKQLLEKKVSFTALFTFYDDMAVGAIQALNEAGKSVPKDVSVMGFGGMVNAKDHGIELSTVSVDGFKMGEKVVKRLLYRRENPWIPVKRILVTGEIVKGDTVSRP